MVCAGPYNPETKDSSVSGTIDHVVVEEQGYMHSIPQKKAEIFLTVSTTIKMVITTICLTLHPVNPINEF